MLRLETLIFLKYPPKTGGYFLFKSRFYVKRRIIVTKFVIFWFSLDLACIFDGIMIKYT